MNVAESSITKSLAAASFALALTATTSTSAAPPVPSAGTLTIEAPFGSSPVLAWSWGASNGGSTGGGGAGKASIQDLSVSRNADGQSALFFDYVVRGEHLKTVVLVDGSTTITLSNVLVNGYTTGNSADAKSTTRTENLTFSFAKVAYTVNGVTSCFDLSTGARC